MSYSFNIQTKGSPLLFGRSQLICARCIGVNLKEPLVGAAAVSPFEEFHQQADVEQASEDEEQTVPQTDAGVKRIEIKIVVITDAPDD